MRKLVELVEGGDAAATPLVRKLLDTTRQSLFDAVPQCRPGNHLGDVSNAVQTTVEAEGLFYPPDPNSLKMCCIGGNSCIHSR